MRTQQAHLYGFKRVVVYRVTWRFVHIHTTQWNETYGHMVSAGPNPEHRQMHLCSICKVWQHGMAAGPRTRGVPDPLVRAGDLMDYPMSANKRYT